MKFRATTVAACVWMAAIALLAVEGRLKAAPTYDHADLRGGRLQPAQVGDTAPYDAMLKQYCVTCHSQRLKTGDLVLEGLDLSQVSTRPDLWEKVIKKVDAGVMPPQGMPRPAGEGLHALTS